MVNSNTTKYFLDGSNVLADYDGDDTLLATYLTPGLDANLSQTRAETVLSGDLPVAPTRPADGLGSIRDLVD